MKQYSINLEYSPSLDSDINQTLGLKISYDRYISILTLGIDVKPLTSFDQSTVFLTPKIGFNIYGWFHLSYGRNINLTNINLRNIGENMLILKILNNHPLSSGYDRSPKVSF
ncbi:hypothetical protein LX97_01311 [Nonlabens dokdonensis]|jgi:hypothetical protein|uniref:Uncharacterized protein n=1 Tax=Nonlabens dokdonensis TaxID=328515 RepID=A0ABX5Q2T3_9FLAO|nr:hypothetical protein [Nonlabens dokdonensis]PZX44300.1 hypothetical protein LX97_01311 [Nonlabens dokdonensis]